MEKRWTPNNASKWQMGFNSVFKALNVVFDGYYLLIEKLWQIHSKIQQWPEKCALLSYYAASSGHFWGTKLPLLISQLLGGGSCNHITHGSDLFKRQKIPLITFEPLYKKHFFKGTSLQNANSVRYKVLSAKVMTVLVLWCMIPYRWIHRHNIPVELAASIPSIFQVQCTSASTLRIKP